MIYTFGGSGAKWHWATWSDWLHMYAGPVTNWAAPGYCSQNIYWALTEKRKQITKDDHVMIIWSPTTETVNWYDEDWIMEEDCWGFFPKENGKLWFTKDDPWLGMYKLHPKHKTSLTQLIVESLTAILHSQWLLDRIGCKYTMMMSLVPWVDSRPTHGRKYVTNWDKKIRFDPKEFLAAKQIIKLDPIRDIIEQIDWTKFEGVPADPFDIENWYGICEYEFRNERHWEYFPLKHVTDNHPNSLTYHDFTLEHLLKIDPLQGKYREAAREIAEQSINIPIPALTPDEFVATPDLPIKFNIEQWLDKHNYNSVK